MINPAMMKKLMKQMNMKPVNAKRVEIYTNGEKLVINNPEVTQMKVMGETIFQIKGDVEKEENIENIPDEDIDLVMEQTGAGREQVEAALEETGGDLAKAIDMLKKMKE